MSFQREKSQSRLPTWLRAFLVVFYILYIGGGAYFGYIFYNTVKEITVYSGSPTQVLANLRPQPATEPSSEGGPVQEQDRPQPEDDERQIDRRLNVLLLAIDRRDCESPPWRTDTMILASIDAENRTAAMLSIPRDLWVDIPSFKPNRINTAHFLGDAYDYPGGGVALAKKTVEQNFGIPVHYYARIDFDGFRKVVDTLGGVTVQIEKPIEDDRYPDEHCGYTNIHIPAGEQHLDGATALQYARSRHGSTDFDRAERQQKVLMAIRDRALSLNVLPRLPQLIRTFDDTVDTDLPASKILTLARIGAEIDPTESVKRAVIDQSMTANWTTPEGAQVLIPKRHAIRSLLDEMLSSPQEAGEQPTAAPAQMVAEDAKVIVQDGTSRDLAEGVAMWLKQQGYQIVDYGPADRSNYDESHIVYYSDKPYTIEFLAEQLKIDPEQIRPGSEIGGNVDIQVILGADFQPSAMR